jgi:hypothetical protein
VTSVQLATTIRAGARDEVTKLVRAFLDQCASQPEPRPRATDADCPFSFRGTAPSGSTGMKWTIVEQPVVDLVKPERPQKDVELEVRTTKAGKAAFTYTFNGTEYGDDDVPIDVRGVVWLDNGAVRFTPAG